MDDDARYFLTAIARKSWWTVPLSAAVNLGLSDLAYEMAPWASEPISATWGGVALEAALTLIGAFVLGMYSLFFDMPQDAPGPSSRDEATNVVPFRRR